MKSVEEIKTTVTTKSTTTTETTVTVENPSKEDTKPFDKVMPKEVGILDMVIAFDTTGSMASYIEAVRKEVADLVPRLFKNNENLRLGIVAFGDYCDMNSPEDFGDAYQCLVPTDNENEIINFIRTSKNTSGGDSDEFYELVIKKIIDETPWREDSTKAVLLIADADPHEVGYTYRDFVVKNKVDWRQEAMKAAKMNIKFDTVTITDRPWYKELSKITNGVSAPFASGEKTSRLVEAAVMSRGSVHSRMMFDKLADACADEEMKNVFACYRSEREDV